VAERYQLPDGRIAEKTPDGKYRIVSSSPAIGPAIGNDPRIPGQLQSQALQAERTRQEIAKNPLDVANALTNIEQGRNSIRQSQIGNVQDLRKEFNALPEVKSYSEYLTQMSKALRAPNTAQGDLNVIYAYAKAMDPGSVVREGEMDMANSTSSLVQDIARRYGKIAEGNRLPAGVRHGLVESIRSAGHGFADAYAQRYRQYGEQAAAVGGPKAAKQVVGNHLGDAFNQLEKDYVARFKGSTPGISTNQRGNVIHEDSGAGLLQGSDTGFIGGKGGTHTEYSKELAGANAAINAMLKSGVPDRDIAAYLKSRGAEDAAVLDIMGQVRAVRQFQRQNPGFKGDFNVDVERQEVPNSAFQNFMNSDVGTGLALGANALSGGVGGLMAGNQTGIEAARSTHPKSALAGEVAGAVGGTLGVNKALSQVPGLAARPGARMIAADMGYGGLYGATQNPDNPGAGAAIGAFAGLAGNQIGSRALAPGLRAGGAAIGFNPAPALPKGQNILASQTLKAGPEDVINRLQEAQNLDMPFSLADAAPQLRALGGSVTRKSPDAFALASENLGNRTLGQVDRLTGIVEGEMGPRLNLPTFKEGVKKTAQAKSRPLYESAKAQPPVDDPLVNEMLQTPAGQRAARSGYDEAINNGEPVGDLVQEVDSITGQVRLVGRPSWNVLQRMKFALDEMPDQTSLARRFNSQLGKLSPDFRKANLTYAKEMRQGDIAEAGYGAASPNVRAPELSAAMAAPRNLKDPGLFRQGYGSNLIDKARGMRDSGNPYEIASMASPDQLAKMQAISPGLFGKFGQARGIEKEMSLTNQELFGGSPTASRTEADKLFEGGTADAALDLGFSVAAGTPPINAMRAGLFAGRTGFGGVKDAWRLGSLRNAQAKADEMAPILFNPDPAENLLNITEYLAAKRARDAYVQRTGLFGSAVGAPVAISLSNR
jgi:hypothetical protein